MGKDDRIIKLRLEGLGYKAIAKNLDLSRDYVRDYCKRHNISGDCKNVKENYIRLCEEKRICKRCGKKLKHTQGKKKKTFCSDYCRKRYNRERGKTEND